MRREIGREGKNRVYLNDQPATLRLLQALAPALLRVHGQREELGLADPGLQRQWLDRSGGDAGLPLRAEVAHRFETWRAIADRLERVEGDERLRLERIDLLRFQAREIDDARLVACEEEELRRDRDLLRHHEAILGALAAAHGALLEEEGSASERLGRARQELAGISEWEPAAAAALAELDELRTRAAEIDRTLAARLASIDAEPGRLDGIEERLAALERLFRKYGGGSAEILARREELGRELAALEEDSADRGELEQRFAEALEAYRVAALQLSAARARWGGELAARLQRELGDLALRGTRLEVALERARRADSAARPRRRAGGVRRRRFRPRRLPLRAQSGRAAGAAGARRLGRRAGAGVARAPARGARRGGGGGARRSSSTRSTPASAARRGPPSAVSCAGSPGGGRSSP